MRTVVALEFACANDKEKKPGRELAKVKPISRTGSRARLNEGSRKKSHPIGRCWSIIAAVSARRYSGHLLP
jgi:hypothetical protein